MARSPGPNLCCLFFHDYPAPSETLGILSFDAVKTMCRLISLYKSLADVEIHRLRRHVIKSKGVQTVNSLDECFLLNLACAERLEDLNLAAAAVSRLGTHCSDQTLSRFDAVYNEIKNGNVDLRKLEFGTRNVEKVIEKVEKLVSSTRLLHNAMESLAEMEVSEKKLQRWRNMRANNGLKVKVECFNDRIVYHRRQVEYFIQMSLWNMTFDKVVGLMAQIVCIVYGRICVVFGSLLMGCINKNNNQTYNVAKVKGLYRMRLENYVCRMEHRELYKINDCIFEKDQEEMPMKKRVKNPGHVSNKTGVVRFNNGPPPVLAPKEGGVDAKNNIVFRLAPQSTVGGAGLSHRYANVILFMERCVHASAAIGKDARAALYELLPGRLKVKLRRKLSKKWMKWEEGMASQAEGDSTATERWHDEAEEVMDWLAPLAQDTLRWQAERNLEKQKFETKPTVLLLQTLHYSNLEKVEEAIIEVLVGLSCIYYQKEW